MNERMTELYKEASEFAYKICREEGRTGGHTDHIWNTLSTGKFAELIVKECVATLTKLGNAYKGSEESEYEFGDFHYMQGILDSADVIKEHFGVEE